MALTDRQAADLRKEDAVAKAYTTLAQHKAANRGSPAMGFRNGLMEAVRQLRVDLIDLYADVDGAGEEPLRSELVTVVSDRVSAFIHSCVAGVRGDNAAMAARTGARMLASMTMGVARDLDLGVHARLKARRQDPVPASPLAPARTQSTMIVNRDAFDLARRQLLPPALDLRDGVRTYLRRLGSDGGKLARMSRSSHRGLVQTPAELLSTAWKEVRVDLLETAIDSAFESGQFVARTDALNTLSDHPTDADEFDRQMRELLVVADSFIRALQDANHLDPDAALAVELKYKAIVPVREGGFGVLYRGIDLADVEHAIKVLHPSPFVSARTAEPRFQREADALKQLDHPNIVKYQRLGRLDDGRWFLEMEFIRGKTLANWIEDDATFEQRITVMLELLDALDHAHQAGVFHRDIKPDNVMVRDDGSVVLIDFGLAWLTGQASATLTTHSTWSLDYAPPEVREDPNASRGPTHDIYSVGVVLHQVFAGRRPSFPQRVPLAEVDPRLAILDPVIESALADIAGRFRSAALFHCALAAAAKGVVQPWLRQAADAARIRIEPLRDVLVAGADLAHGEDFEQALILIAGSYEALRIHWQREFRLARGSDAPRIEWRIPSTISPCAQAAFPSLRWVGAEPALGEDVHGAAALTALGFAVSDEGNFRDLVEATHPLRTPNRTTRDAPTEEKLLTAHTALVQRILQLETKEAAIMNRFVTEPVGWRDHQQPAPDREGA